MRCAGLLLLLTLGFGHAQPAFPSHDVTFIVPWPAGGSTDIIARLIAAEAEKNLGVTIVVKNIPGAGGAFGARELINAKPDCYTIAIDGTGIVARQYLLADQPKLAEFQPIVYIGGDPLALVVGAGTPWQSLEEFLGYAKENEVLLSGLEPGSSFYNATLILEDEFNLQLNKIPYHGFAEMGPALLAGEIEAGVSLLTDWIPFYENGDVRILGVMDSRRHADAPDVPTFEEATGKPFVQTVWRSIFAPAGVENSCLQVLEQAFLDAMGSPELVQRFNNAGYVLDPRGAEETWDIWQRADLEMYPILLAMDMVVSPKE